MHLWVHSTMTGVKDRGQGHNSGVWEWTLTVFDKHEGFDGSMLYPRFSADLFDTHHNVVVCSILWCFSNYLYSWCWSKIGGSYATTPRQAEHHIVPRFFQRNYPYTWNGGQVAYDMAK